MLLWGRIFLKNEPKVLELIEPTEMSGLFSTKPAVMSGLLFNTGVRAFPGVAKGVLKTLVRGP